ncbi:hypothetical protein BT63DRAFT_111069 [Microthyrium microscopicum]|uniref:Mid2 domain-containing protein n=1 Tax=Microthyrium microscopicum TaxID=703497 RepID=A0A6A6TWL8_9PEZI|nr:hypothetical protein BT63DRAFT_111069 [Microthyrium microscopicum]
MSHPNVLSIVKDSCEWGPANTFPASNNTANGGLCAYLPNTNRLYACPAPDPTCWAFNQSCKGGTNTPSADQILCGASNSADQWCCAQYETCTTSVGQINVCVSSFNSPNKGTTPAEARAAEYKDLPSASIKTDAPTATPSAFSTRQLGAAAKSSDSSSSQSSGSSSSTSSSGSAATSSSASSSSGISGGAIAGIVIGALAVLAIAIGAIVFFMMRRKKRGYAAASTGPHEKPAAGDGGYYGPTSYDAGGYQAGETYAKVQPGTSPHVAPAELPAQERPQELQA